jgi:Xaa-Pro aminopeptidase
VHAGNRSGIPARATDFSLTPLTSLKIDAGVEIYDSAGNLRAVSDITRSVVGTPAAEEAQQLLEAAMLHGTIAECVPGATGDDVFRATTAYLEPHRGELTAAGFCPDGIDGFEQCIRRDVGHLLGKQEPSTTVLTRGNAWPIEPGMVAAAELQWPVHPYCFGVEDVFMTTESEPINLTRSA